MAGSVRRRLAGIGEVVATRSDIAGVAGLVAGATRTARRDRQTTAVSSLPLDRARRLGRDVQDHAVHTVHLTDDAP